MQNELKSEGDGNTPFSVSNRIPVEELTGQFLLSKSKIEISWEVDSIGEWNLAVHQHLPCWRIYIGAKVAGWLLGHAISSDGSVVDSDLRLQSDNIEASIYSHGGRFLVILPELQRVYMDPSGLISALYCEHAQIVASSTNLIPYEEETRERTEFQPGVGVLTLRSVFPVGMTARHGVQRIIPNHYLDLNTWKMERHWPDRALSPIEDVSSAVAEIASITKRQIQAVLNDGPGSLRLTAGKDSRMLLACARNVAGELDCITADLGDYYSQNDCRIAEKLSRVAGVPHRTLHQVEPEPRDLELWLLRTGFASGVGRGYKGSTTYRTQMDPSRSDIIAYVGEVARGKYYLPDDLPNTEITSERLLAICKFPETPETIARIDDWKSEAVVNDSLQLLDFFYLENDNAYWSGLMADAEAAYSRYQTYPMCHRRIIELMIRLPMEMRRNGTLPDEIISSEWPELLRYPFNKLPFFGRQWDRIKRAARDPKRTASNLRGRLRR